MLPLESVPNFSEGRDQATIDAIGAALGAHARLLDVHADADHNRSVFTLVGSETELADALLAGIAVAVERIDLRTHEGAHPRIGAADVVPIVPLRPEDLERARTAALAVGARIGSELGLPVFVYAPPERGPAFYRRGGPAELQRRIDDGELVPDYGPPRLHETAGGVIVGARAPLIAFNVNLRGDVEVARAIAAIVRERGGGFPGVRALGLDLPRAGLVQVSMNVEDWEASALHEIVARIDAEATRARRRGGRFGARRPDARRRGGRRGRGGAQDRRVRRVARARAAAAVESIRTATRGAASPWRRPNYTRGVTATHALTGDDLSLDDVWAVAVERRPAAMLSDAAREQMHAARAVVEAVAHGAHEHTYGVNTGFGRFVSKSIPEEQTEELQLRLLRSHACGVGDPYPDAVVRAAMLLRANALAKGNSGARVETVELLLECLNRGVLPFVPARGSVGASGDLAPLAHLALPLVGEGRAWWEGELLDGGEALGRAGLEPVRLAREGGLVADQRDAVHGGAGRARARSRLAARPRRRLRVRAVARGAAGVAQLVHSRRCTRCGRSVGSRRLRATSCACSTARRSSSRIAGATRCRTRTRFAARRRCTVRRATCSTTSTTPSRRS